MNSFAKLTVWLLCLIGMASSTSAQDFFGSEFGTGEDLGPSDPVEMVAYYKVQKDGRKGKLYIEAAVEEGWHVYSVTQPKGGPIRSTMTLLDSEDFKIIGPWEPNEEPHVKFSELFDTEVESHEELVIWSAPFEFSEGVDTKGYKFEIKYSGQTCDSSGCLPLDFNLTAEYDSVEESEVVAKAIEEAKEEPAKELQVLDTPEQIEEMAKLYDAETAIKYEKLDGSSGSVSVWVAIFGAFVGGMLLNLMPCVFPVLGLKVMGFVEQAGSDPKKIKMHGIAFALGLLTSMWVLGGIILIIKATTGEEVNWGQQMGDPFFIGAIVILLFVLGLNLAGVFEMGMFMTRVGGQDNKKGYTGSFVSGIITTLVATPCSGPFLGTAMGYTLAPATPSWLAMILFTIFGLGIAFPYIFLAFFPALINMLPRPGAWMETFKKFMAFTLFAAAAFFVKAFGSQTGADGLSWFLMALCVISLGFFFYGKWSPSYVKGGKRLVWGWLAPVVICGLGIWMYVDAAKMEAPPVAGLHDGWQIWVPGKVEQTLAEHKKPIWVDYTADW